eukprot:Phypoly_transcript_05259.p1 GENE.Phypoly_transcript_05259~~Phypoly_transcript_05259.p1  ORF type:complete len:234 (+),score=13.25 Phypoly_transcript_05259:983-1684(+)
MPRGVIGSLCVTIVLYLGSSLVITGMVNFVDLKTNTPFVDAFVKYKAFWVAAIVAAGSLLCMVTTILSSLLGLPRILYQMSNDGLLPDQFARLNRFRVPHLGTIGIAALSILLTSFFDFSVLNNMICCGVLLNYTLIDIGVIALRHADVGRKIERKNYLLVLATILSSILFGLAISCPNIYVKISSIIPFSACMVAMCYTMPLHQLAHPPNVDSSCVPLSRFYHALAYYSTWQ